jgi:hypothetical protein
MNKLEKFKIFLSMKNSKNINADSNSSNSILVRNFPFKAFAVVFVLL